MTEFGELSGVELRLAAPLTASLGSTRMTTDAGSDGVIFKQTLPGRHAFRQLTNDVDHCFEDRVVVIRASIPDR